MRKYEHIAICMAQISSSTARHAKHDTSHRFMTLTFMNRLQCISLSDNIIKTKQLCSLYTASHAFSKKSCLILPLILYSLVI